MGSFDSMEVGAAQERDLTPPFIVSMSPPGYPSAWLRPRSARFHFARPDHCSSATTCRFSTSALALIPPEPRPGQTRIVNVIACFRHLCWELRDFRWGLDYLM